ncbi:hypothetical protein FYJ24_09010 [Actinomycetaceae bacterium WB03_NA08]|uniref:Uncharacterized protein n=1 Tax=Scrofimicrobium canadense TaxID=2652290 RepID=A0A6N7W689_9ACTO|nr:hypothetical protein [Scrofimicrobium canadense]MSS84901.1 hypothetical protein [Scrofimicrobium canadense]
MTYSKTYPRQKRGSLLLISLLLALLGLPAITNAEAISAEISESPPSTTSASNHQQSGGHHLPSSQHSSLETSGSDMVDEVDESLPLFSPDGPLTRALSPIVGPIQADGAPRTGVGYEWNRQIGNATWHWLGAQTTGNGLEWCTNLDSLSPTGPGDILLNPTPNPVQGFQNDYWTITPAQMGYIFKNHQENNAETRAAISWLVHGLYETGAGRAHAGALVGDVLNHAPAISNRAKELINEARTSAVVAVKVDDVTVTPSKMGFTLSSFGVKSESGAWVDGIPFKVTLTGPAVFDNGSQTYSGTTSSGLTLSGHSTGNGTAHAKYEFFPNWVGIMLRERLGTQTTLTMQPGNPAWLPGEGRPFDLVFDFQPVVSSVVTSKFVAAGSDFVDTISMKADSSYGDGTWTQVDGKPVPATVTTDVYYAGSVAPTVSDEVPADAVKVGSVSSTFNGAGDQKITVPTDGRGGYFVAKTRFEKNAQPEKWRQYFHGDATYQWGLASETTVMQVTPTITTKASDKRVEAGVETSDMVTIHLKEGEKWPTGATLKAKGTRYGPFSTPLPQSSTVPASAPVAGTADLEFTANGQTKSVPWSADTSGVYTWVWQIDKDTQTNPDLWATSFRDDFMIHAETTVVPWNIEHSSMAREYNVHVDGRAFDTVNISNLPGDHGTYEGDDYWMADVKEARVVVYDAGPDTDWANQDEEIPPHAQIHWETTVEAVNGVFNIGYDDNNPITSFNPGHDYVFVYHFEGDDRVNSFHSPFNDILERFHVPGQTPVPPTVATQAQKDVMVGEPFGDTALVMGDVEEGSTLVFEAFGPQPEDETPSCEAPFFTSDPIAVSGAGYYDSPTTTVDKPGVVYWMETLYGPDGSIIHTGTCGVPSETTTVIPYEPHISTTAVAGADNPMVGDEIWDTLNAGWKSPDGHDVTDPAVTPWPYPVGSTTTVDLYWADHQDNLTCQGDPLWSADPVNLVEGTTKYTTNKYTTDKAGVYTFVETTRNPEGVIVSQGTCGDPDETLTIGTPPPPPALAKTGSSGTWLLGGFSVSLFVLGAGLRAFHKYQSKAK